MTGELKGTRTEANHERHAQMYSRSGHAMHRTHAWNVVLERNATFGFGSVLDTGVFLDRKGSFE